MSITQLKPGQKIPDGEPRRYPNSKGYVRLRWKMGVREYVECYEHRVENGFVTRSEQVHHKNLNPSDNSSENLEPTTFVDHGRLHREIDYDYVTDLYNEGMSFPQISDLTGWDSGAICRAVNKTGKTREYVAHNRIEVDRELITRLHKQGYSASYIAEQLDVSRGIIYSRIREWGLTPHAPGRKSDYLEKRLDS